jgi:hypothetical protein
LALLTPGRIKINTNRRGISACIMCTEDKMHTLLPLPTARAILKKQ